MSHVMAVCIFIEWHHIVPRAQLGDDCAEIEYCAMKCGPGWLQAAYGGGE